MLCDADGLHQRGDANEVRAAVAPARDRARPATAVISRARRSIPADELAVITDGRAWERRGATAPAGPGRRLPAVEQAKMRRPWSITLAVGPLAVFGDEQRQKLRSRVRSLTLATLAHDVRGAVLHEPGVYAVLDDFDVVRAPLQGVVRQSIAERHRSAAGAVLAVHRRRRRRGHGFPPHSGNGSVPASALVSDGRARHLMRGPFRTTRR